MLRICFFTSALFVFSIHAFAQSELDKYVGPEGRNPKDVPSRESRERANPAAADIEDFSGLWKLVPFNDVAVIQRRFLPKTKRFEFFPNVGFVLNDLFYFPAVFGARLGYSFNEFLGIEVVGQTVSVLERRFTKQLEQEQNIHTTAFTTPKSYLGADIKWSPMYGKMGFSNRSIVPFDMHFLVGGGMLKVQVGKDLRGVAITKDVTGIRFGMGQKFALNKWMALRWDVGFLVYSVAPVGRPKSNFMNMHLGMGLSFFFPGAKYR